MSKHLRSIVTVLFLLSTTFLFGQAELCPPFGVSVFEGDSEVVVSWNEPIGSVGCGDEGITALPFTATGSNVGTGDDWDVAGGDGDDYTYTLNLSYATVLTIDLCSATTDYDSKLEVFTADAACVATSTGYYDDDGPFGSCPESPAPYTPSLLENVALDPGQYYIVVDGFSGATGNFEISVTENARSNGFADFKAAIEEEAEKLLDLGATTDEIDALWADAREHMSTNSTREISPECGTFVSYHVYDAADGSLVGSIADGSTFLLVDGLTNDTEYCFYVTTEYSEGTSANSDTACGIPAPYVPDAPTNPAVVIGDEELTLSWTPSTVPQVGLGYVETFDIADLAALWTWEGENWSIYEFTGNPEPSARFNWSPSQDFYEYSLYSMALPVGDTTDVEVIYDMYLNDFGNTGTEHLSVELWVDGAWVVLADYSNTADINWASYSHTVTDVSGTTQIRFKAYGDDSFEIDQWYVDNIGLLDASTGREIANSSISAVSEYLGGATMDLEFWLDYESSDADWLDGATVTFPAGFTVNSATDIGGLVYNGETGDGVTVSWGDFADDQLGEQYADIEFFVNVSIAEGVSGPQTFGWTLSADTWGDPPNDTSGTFIMNETSFNEYDFMGYNVFLDGVLQNNVPTPSMMWLFDGLTNLQEYELGVAARHFPNYSSDTVSVLATPQYLFGDVAGYVLDPNGDPLDSAVVRAGGVSDTTGADGYYFLWNLDPGMYTVKAERANFEFTEEEIEVIAGPDPTVQDLVLQPALDIPCGVMAYGADEAVDLVWNKPCESVAVDLTGTWQLNFDWGCTGAPGSVAVEFTEDGFLIVDGTPMGNWFAEEGEVELASDGGSCGGGFFEFNAWFNFFDFATIYYFTVEDDAVFSGPMTSGFGGHDGDNSAVRLTARNSGRTSGTDYALISEMITGNDNHIEEVVESMESSEYRVATSSLNVVNTARTDSLVGYNVYQMRAEGDTLVLTTYSGDDTTGTVGVEMNYVEYCFYVKAIWETDNYGTLESKPSPEGCAVPFKSGDADFDSDVDLNDVVAVVDFILEITVPTEDQFRNCDYNMDGAINVADLVMMIDEIYGGAGRFMAFDPDALASLQ